MTGRQEREAAFHDEWAAAEDPGRILVDEAFTSVTAPENQLILRRFGDLRGKRVLDYGSGAGEGGVFFAKQGADVVCIDVSPGMLSLVERVADRHGVRVETRRVDGSAIPASDGEFDLIYGNSVLHHVPLPDARKELARILKPHGTGCFIEPLGYNPIINVYRWMARPVRTRDERPLTFADIRSFGQRFAGVEHEEFWLATLAVFLKFYFIDRVSPARERYWKKIHRDVASIERLYRRLRRVDNAVLPRLPFLRPLCWSTVITLTGPRK